MSILALEQRQRSLPVLLMALTVVTGVVDAVSYLELGRVFVANMTGNVVFLGFAWAGDAQLSVAASLVALGVFLGGAVVGGRLAHQIGSHRGRLLLWATALTALAVLAAFVLASVDPHPGTAPRYTLIVLLAAAMGVQNASSRHLAVADATTTVLTLTLTGLAADSFFAGGTNPRPLRRIAAVLCMFTGALVGGLLALHQPLWAPLLLAAGLLGLILAAVAWLVRGSAAEHWAQPKVAQPMDGPRTS